MAINAYTPEQGGGSKRQRCEVVAFAIAQWDIPQHYQQAETMTTLKFACQYLHGSPAAPASARQWHQYFFDWPELGSAANPAERTASAIDRPPSPPLQSPSRRQ
ncbi:hypothetical protein BC828DRAFT_415486 [Blastocladiella britannica]|nr:hypothetical protein BC828DRAFT_415486 [Blastocladiella britannica]